MSVAELILQMQTNAMVYDELIASTRKLVMIESKNTMLSQNLAALERKRNAFEAAAAQLQSIANL